MKLGAKSWLIIRGVILIVTGYLAAIGMTFVCLVRNYIQTASGETFDIGPPVPDAIYAVFLYAAFFIAMAIWIFIAGRFAWRNRAWLGLTLSLIAFSVFAINAYNVLRLAYPVCNAF